MKRKAKVSLLSVMLLVLAGTATPVSAQSRDKAKEAELIQLLKNESTPGPERAMACKLLALHGGPDCVALLGPMLADEKFASWARIALEAIPGPEAAAVLRDASQNLNGKLLVGVLNSIGVRRDADSLDMLNKRLADPSSEVAGAAALALGRIGGDAAEAALRSALTNSNAELRSAAAEGCILCAERRLASGDANKAIALYDEVRESKVSKPRLIEATRGAILARAGDGLPLLLEQLKSNDVAMQRLALTVVREINTPQVTEALTAELKTAKASMASMLLIALADRGDRSALPAVMLIAKQGDDAVRVTAAEVLESLGDTSSVPTLLELATQSNKDIRDAAMNTLERMKGKEIDDAILSRISSASGPTLSVLIELIGKRRLPAMDQLKAAIKNKDRDVRRAAIAALGETIEGKDLSLLAEQLASASSEDLQTVEQALRSASVRMEDREATAKVLTSTMTGKSTAVKSKLLEILSEVGGTTALGAMRAAASGNDEVLRDTSTRLLGEWFDVDAGPVLYELAQLPPNNYTVRVVRAYIRLARQFTMSDADRAEMVRKAMKISKREQEQQLVIEIMERYPSDEMLSAAMEVQTLPKLKEAAQRAIMMIAVKLPESKSVDDRLAKFGIKPATIEIVKAEYGSNDSKRDVTDVIRGRVRKLPVIALPATTYNKSFGGDPAVNATKQLRIQYRINGREGEATFKENEPIFLK